MSVDRRFYVTGASTFALMAAWHAPASAQSNQELMEIIRQQQQQIEELSRKVDALQGQAAVAEQPTVIVEEDEELQSFEFDWAPSPTIRSKDGNFEVHLRGRLYVDGGYIDDDDGFYSGDNATELRAARLGIEGKAWKDFGYKFEIDFSGNDVDIKDAFIEYKGPLTGPAYVRVGQFKTPNSLEEQTSSRYITFMERAAFTDAFELDRRIGLGSGVSGENWGVDAGLFGQNAGDSENNEGYAVAARGHYAWLSEDRVFHLGASARYRNLNNDADGDSVRYRQRPFFHFTNTRSVDTGVLDNAKSDVFLGGEHASVLGPFSFQTEAGHTWLQRDNGEDNADGLWGGYLSASYFLTGESRNYDAEEGVFGRVKVTNPVHEGGWGAWEVGARFDYIDLNDNGADVEGGEQYSAIAGVNWYLTNHIRTMLDFAWTHVYDADDAPNAAADGSSNDIFGVGARAQVDW